MGINRGALYVSGFAGAVYGGKNGVSSALPSIPLNPTYFMVGPDTAYWNQVGGLIKDSKGRLVAATDSIGWWFDGTKWNPIDTTKNYMDPVSLATTSKVYLHPSGNLWFVYDGKITVVSPDLNIVDTITQQGASWLSFGTDGRAWEGTNDCLWLYVRHPPNYTLDSIDLRQYSWKGECSQMAGAAYADNNGWVWATVSGPTQSILHGDSIKYFVTTTDTFDVVCKILLAPDSTFWMCSTSSGLYKYSEKYSIPPEAMGITAVTPANKSQSFFSTSLNGSMLGLSPALGSWNVSIADVRGAIAWSSAVTVYGCPPQHRFLDRRCAGSSGTKLSKDGSRRSVAHAPAQRDPRHPAGVTLRV